MRRKYTLFKEPEADLYADLLRAGLEQASVLGLVFRKGSSADSSPVAEALVPYVLEEETVSEWPGTRSQEAQLRRLYEYNAPVVDILGQAVTNLFDWQMPNLPGDPHLLRADRSTWLGTISHERDAWLEMSDTEWITVNNAHPLLGAALADEEDVRGLVRKFWEEHLAGGFPPGLAGAEIGDGVVLGYLDSTVAGCIDSFVSGSGSLDESRLDVLKGCWNDLDNAAGMLEGEGEIYFHRLWKMTDLVLGFHHVDPMA